MPAAYQSAYQPVHPRGSASGRSRTVPTLDSHRASIPAVDGMEEVRGSSPLSSTAKVLVKAYLILRPTIVSCDRRHLGLTDAVRSRSARVITIPWASGELPASHGANSLAAQVCFGGVASAPWSTWPRN
jgi:hypothetical protein